jgi:hypothetical protein
MKLFYTPAINGEYAELAKRRMADMQNNEAYERVLRLGGQDSVDQLDDRGWTKIKNRDDSGKSLGYWTFQQDEL